MTGEPEQFMVDVAAFVEKSKLAMHTVYRKVVLDVMRGVIMGTPVDTGRARGAWLVAVGNEPTGEGTPDRGGARALADGSREVRDLKAGQVTFLINRVPYIRILEYGGYPNPPAKGTRLKGGTYVVRSAGGMSKQAPNGMVRVTVRRVQESIASAVQQLGGGQ